MWYNSSAPRDRRVHWTLGWFTTEGLGVVGFIPVCVGSLGCTQLASGSFRFAWVHSSTTWGRRLHSGLGSLTWAFLVVAGVIGDHVGPFGRT